MVKTEAAARDSIGQAKALQAAAEARLAEAVTWPPFSLMTLKKCAPRIVGGAGEALAFNFGGLSFASPYAKCHQALE